MAEQTEARLQRAMDVIVRIQRIDNPKTVKAFEPFLRKDAALLLEAIDGPTSGWRDVVKAMRAAGFKLVKAERISKNWTHRSLVDRGVEVGDVAINQHGDRFVSLHGKDGWSVEMKNPSPAKVFEAARLLGLVAS